MADKSSLRTTIIGASILFVADGLFVGQGIISALVLVCAVGLLFYSGIKALIRKNTDAWKIESKKLAIVLVAAACALVVISLNNSLAERRTLRVAAACTQYKAKYQRYPKNLDELVPEFMPSVPVAKYILMTDWANFIYYGKTSPVIGYMAMPPFGRRLYHVETKMWGYME